MTKKFTYDDVSSYTLDTRQRRRTRAVLSTEQHAKSTGTQGHACAIHRL